MQFFVFFNNLTFYIISYCPKACSKCFFLSPEFGWNLTWNSVPFWIWKQYFYIIKSDWKKYLWTKPIGGKPLWTKPIWGSTCLNEAIWRQYLWMKPTGANRQKCTSVWPPPIRSVSNVHNCNMREWEKYILQ